MSYVLFQVNSLSMHSSSCRVAVLSYMLGMKDANQVIIPRNSCSWVQVPWSGYCIDSFDLFWVRVSSVPVIDVTKEGDLLFGKGALVDFQHKAILASNSHEVMLSGIMLYGSIAMDAEVIGNSYNSSALFHNVVNLLLKDVLTAD